MTTAIIDYGSGNLRSAAKAFERAAAENGIADPILVTSRPDEVAKAVGAAVDTSFVVNGVTFNSRDVEKGDLFFALAGETTDGSALLERLLPAAWLPHWYRFRPYGIAVWFLLVLSTGLLTTLITPFVERLYSFVFA